ncbi:MAG: GGDEF domain-containing protein [Alkalispirochaetaceae bacterium]
MAWRVEREILTENERRARLLALVVFVVQIPLIGIDLWRLRTGVLEIHSGYRWLMYLHLLLEAILGALWLYLRRRSRKSDGEPSRLSSVLLTVGVVLVLYVSGAITMVDQLIHGEITVYLLAAAGIAITFYLPLPYSSILFGSGLLLFYILIPRFQSDPDILTAHYINVSLLTAVAVATNVSLYRKALHSVTQVRLIEEQKEELQRLAWEDELTGLPNRRLGDLRMKEEMARFLRYRRPFALCMGDIDRFKRVNDEHSHAVGDRVLRTVAYLLTSHLREVDLVARYGGEEFVLVMPETSAEEATEVCEKLRAGIEAYEWDQLAPGLEITMSFGVAESSGMSEAEEVLAHADKRLYQAKQAGRNAVRGSGPRKGRGEQP